MALANITLFYFTLVLHELGHSLAARRYDVKVKEIILFLLGGVAVMEDEIETASSEFVIAIAGPLVSVVISIGCLTAFSLITPLDTVLVDGSIQLSGAFTATLFFLGVTNAIMVLFNMIPAYPMDGGRVLHSTLWGLLGWERATNATLGIAVGFAVSFLVGAVYMALGGAIPFVGQGILDGVWLSIFGVLLLANTWSMKKAIKEGRFGAPKTRLR